MKITPYGGAGEIGGNKILLETGRTRVFLDFGIPFDRGAGIYSGFDYVSPRDKMGLKDYFEFNLVPKLPGLYSEEALQYTDLAHSSPKYDAILLSHMHSDHAGDVSDIDPKIPVYVGHGANQLNDCFNTIYPSFKTGLNGNINEMKSGKRFQIKDIFVKPIHVDHSIPGAYGFLLETPEGNVAYTGDFRFHGFRPEMTEEFMKEAAKARCKVLITEGTRVRSGKDAVFGAKMTESDVENRFCEAMNKTDGILFAQFSFRNLDRVRSLYNAAVKAGRMLVVNAGFAYTCDCARALIQGMPKTIGNPNLKVFKKDSDLPDEDRRNREYAKPYLEDCVDYKWVKKNAGDVAMFMTASELSQMVDIRPKSGTFVFSMSEHYIEGEENEEYKECLENWLHHFGIELTQIHCSGHADEAGVRKMIDGIGADIVIPVHTENPDKFKNMAGKVLLPGKEICIKI